MELFDGELFGWSLQVVEIRGVLWLIEKGKLQ
jgi:hypothetical protein